MESCYFGAQTLRTKIQFAFHELPSEAHNSLRDSMLNHLRQINEHTNTVIVTQVIGFLLICASCVKFNSYSVSLSCVWH